MYELLHDQPDYLINHRICLPCVLWGLLGKMLLPLHAMIHSSFDPQGRNAVLRKVWGGSVTRWMFLGHMGILYAKAGFPATCVLDTHMAPKSQPETPCSSYPCATSGQSLLTISVSNRMWFCTYSDYRDASSLSVFCLLCIFLLERCQPFSVSQNFFHSPCSGDFLNAFCFLRMF